MHLHLLCLSHYVCAFYCSKYNLNCLWNAQSYNFSNIDVNSVLFMLFFPLTNLSTTKSYDFYSSLKFYVFKSSYLIASMGLQVLWSFGLACLDVYTLRRKRDLQNPILVSLFVVGDWVLNSFIRCYCFCLLKRISSHYFHVDHMTSFARNIKYHFWLFIC